MKIKDHRDPSGKIVDIYSVYWINNKTIFLGFPKNYGGLQAYDQTNITIIEPEFVGNYIFYDNGIYHWALIKEKLLDNLLELDETAYNRFLDILKSEGQIDSDFY